MTTFNDKQKYEWRLNLLEDLLKSGMINHQQFDLQDTKNKVTLLQIPTPRISELPSSHETTTPGLVPAATKDNEKNGKLDNQNAALETTWWFLQGSNQNLEMFDKAMAHSKSSSYSLEYVIATGENYFFIWKLSDGKTAKEWGKWFLSSYRNAIGAPPPSSSSDSEDEDAAHVDTKNGEKKTRKIFPKKTEKKIRKMFPKKTAERVIEVGKAREKESGIVATTETMTETKYKFQLRPYLRLGVRRIASWEDCGMWGTRLWILISGLYLKHVHR